MSTKHTHPKVSAPECPYCGTNHGLRVASEGYGPVAPDYICEDCFTGTDTGPCFDDLPEAPVNLLDAVREARARYAAPTA